MYIIEPCCAGRQLMQLRDAIGNDGTKEFKGFGDLSLTELLPAILTRYSETELLIAAPSIPDQAAEVIGKWMQQQWPRRDGQGKLNAIRHLTVISDLSRKKSPTASEWTKDNPWGERLKLVSRKQADTVILLPDFAVTGPVNMCYGESFVATATTARDHVAGLWKQYADAGNTENPAADTTGAEDGIQGQDPAASREDIPVTPASDSEKDPVKAALEKMAKAAKPRTLI